MCTKIFGQRCNLHDDKSNETKIERIERYGVMRVKKNLQQFNNECLDEKSVMEDLRCVSCCKKYFDDETIVREGESFPMIITNDQGLLEIHIIRLKLASMATDIFRKQKNINDLSLFITWDLWNNEQPFTPTVKYSKFNFNSSLIYRLTSLFDFFDRILGQTISLRIHISHRRNNYLPVARAYLSIKDILDYPQNKLHYVANFTSTLPCSGDHNFGQLSLWIRLSCDVDKVKMFRERRGISGDSLIGKKIEKISNDNEKKFRRSSRDSKIKDELSSSRLDDVEIGSLTKLNRETSLRSENGRMGKEIFLSSRLNDKNSSSLLGASRISRNSKNSAKKRFISEASSSTLGRSFVNGKSMNNASAAESYLTISPEISTVKRSDSSMIRAMEDEDTTSEEFRNEDKKLKEGSPTKSLLEEGRKSKEYNDRVETDSVNEFNNLIRNGTILSPRESRSSVQDLGNVFTDHNWQKYRKRSMAAEPKSLRPSIVPTEADGRSKNSYTVSDHSTSSSEAVIIRIESISLFQRSSLLDDPEIHQIYVEFTFLGYRGVELETISVPKPLSSDTRAYFNYMRKFELDEEEHSVQRNIMRDIMTENENPTIKFIIVSEPLIEEMETKECEEVGYAYFNIRDHILRGLSKNVSLTIMSVVKKQPIGILKITLLGAEAIRRCMSDL